MFDKAILEFAVACAAHREFRAADLPASAPLGPIHKLQPHSFVTKELVEVSPKSSRNRISLGIS